MKSFFFTLNLGAGQAPPSAWGAQPPRSQPPSNAPPRSQASNAPPAAASRPGLYFCEKNLLRLNNLSLDADLLNILFKIIYSTRSISTRSSSTICLGQSAVTSTATATINIKWSTRLAQFISLFIHLFVSNQKMHVICELC